MTKIAFILDPYPTRGSMSMLVLQALQFMEITKKLEGSGVQCAIVCSPYIANDIRRRTQSYNAFFSGSYNCRLMFAQAVSNWDSDDVKVWRKINRGSEEWIEAYKAWIASVIELEYDFDYCIVWGNNRSLVEGIARCGLESVVVELGPMRPPLLDLLTFARDASPPTIPVYIASDCATAGAPKSLSLIEDQDYIENLIGKPAYFTLNRYSWNDKFAQSGRQSLSGRKILFAGQLFDDSNASFWKAEIDSIVDELINVTRDNGATLIVKPHPNYRAFEVNETEWKRLRERWAGCEHVFEISHEDLEGDQILAMVDGVVAANSSILFEALYWGLPIYYFGSTYFLPEHNLLSMGQVVTGNYDEMKYLEKISIIRQTVLDEKCISRNDFDNGSFIRKMLEVRIPREPWSFRTVKNEKANLSFSRFPLVSVMRESVEGGRQKIELAEGADLYITAGKVKSNYESIEDNGESIEVKGWCLVETTRSPPAFYVVPIRKDKCLVCPSTLSRPDVARFWHEEDAGMSGFSFKLKKSDVDMSTINKGVIYAYVGKGQIQRLHQGHFNPGDGFFDFTLSYHQPAAFDVSAEEQV